jgi:hypothetical protein
MGHDARPDKTRRGQAGHLTLRGGAGGSGKGLGGVRVGVGVGV